MKKLLLLLGFLLASYLGNAQAVMDWSQHLFGTSSLVYGPKALNNVIANDAIGNVYAIGVFDSPNGSAMVDLDPSTGVFNLNLLSGNIYITKTDPSGNFVWAKQIGGNGPAFAGSITLDAIGNIYISGKVGFGFWDFNPSPTVNSNTYIQDSQVNFIEKLDINANFVWVKFIKNIYDESYDQIDDVSVDDSGNVYATGSYRLNADFDPGAGVVNLSPVTDAFIQIFVLKLDASGSFIWAKAFKQSSGGTNLDISGHAIKSDSSGNVYVCGYFAQGVTDFDPGVGVDNKTSINATSLFVIKLDVMGQLVWVNTYEKIGYSSIGFESKLVLDASNNPIVFDTVYSGGIYNNTIFKLNSINGTEIWTKSITGVTVVIGPNGLTNSGFCESNGMTLDAAGNIYLTGRFYNTVDFDPGAGNFTMTPSANPNNMITNFDGYFLKLDAGGNFIYANKIGDLGNDYVSNIIVSPSGKVIIKGSAGVGGFNKTTATPEGSFMASYSQPSLATSQFDLQNTILVYPNPTSSNFNINVNKDLVGAKVTVYSALGQKVKCFVLKDLTTNENLNTGMYLLEIEKEGNTIAKKLIVN